MADWSSSLLLRRRLRAKAAMSTTNNAAPPMETVQAITWVFPADLSVDDSLSSVSGGGFSTGVSSKPSSTHVTDIIDSATSLNAPASMLSFNAVRTAVVCDSSSCKERRRRRVV